MNLSAIRALNEERAMGFVVDPAGQRLIGGILLLVRNRPGQRLGQLLAFSGFAINLYAMIGLRIGFSALGQPMQGPMLWTNIVLTFLGVLAMVHLAAVTLQWT